MNREQMVDSVAFYVHRARINDMWDMRSVAVAILGTILPQVSTVAELEALPETALVLKVWNGRAETQTAGSLARAVRYLGEDFIPSLPLTVVWQPEEAK